MGVGLPRSSRESPPPPSVLPVPEETRRTTVPPSPGASRRRSDGMAVALVAEQGESVTVTSAEPPATTAAAPSVVVLTVTVPLCGRSCRPSVRKTAISRGRAMQEAVWGVAKDDRCVKKPGMSAVETAVPPPQGALGRRAGGAEAVLTGVALPAPSSAPPVPLPTGPCCSTKRPGNGRLQL